VAAGGNDERGKGDGQKETYRHPDLQSKLSFGTRGERHDPSIEPPR
jgi:hypothetical protein